MSEITQELRQAAQLPRLNLGTMLAGTGHALCEAVSRSRTRSIVATLSDDQLRDIGVDRSTVLGNKAVIRIDRGLISYLMSLR